MSEKTPDMIDSKHWDDCVSLDSYDRRLLQRALGFYRDLVPIAVNRKHVEALIERLDEYPHRYQDRLAKS